MSARFDRMMHVIAGVGPLLFLAIATVEGMLRPGYDPVAQPISALALGPRGWIQTANFAILAASFCAMVVILRAQFRGGVRAAALPGVFVVMMIGIVLAALFPMDAAGATPTMEGKVHVAAGFLVFPWIPIALGVASRQFRIDASWRSFARATVLLAIVSVATIVFFLLFVGPPGSPRRYPELAGLVQRAQVLPFFLWIAAVARRAYKLPHRVASAGVGVAALRREIADVVGRELGDPKGT